jgi:hypothetical protein
LRDTLSATVGSAVSVTHRLQSDRRERQKLAHRIHCIRGGFLSDIELFPEFVSGDLRIARANNLVAFQVECRTVEAGSCGGSGRMWRPPQPSANTMEQDRLVSQARPYAPELSEFR